MRPLRYPIYWFFILLITALGSAQLTACAAKKPLPPPPERDYWPTSGWRTDAAADHGLDEAALANLRAGIEKDLPFLDSLLIVKDGYLVHEEYFNGYDAGQTHHLHSVTKSVLSILYGLAQAEGRIPSLDATLGTVLPESFAGGQYQDKRRITLRHLLQMRSGLELDEAAFAGELWEQGEEEAISFYLGRDETELALSQPLAHRPGEAWNYATLNSHLLSAAFSALTEQSLAEAAGEKLFPALGITDWTWPTDDRGVSAGGFLLQLTPRDMAKIGFLVLNRGQWEGQQLIPEAWIKLSTSPQGAGYHIPIGREIPIEWYGYHWWTWRPELFGGQRTIIADGHGGQRIVLLPDLDMIVVTTANPVVSLETSEASQVKVNDMIIRRILPAVTETHSPDPFWEVPAAKPAPGGGLYTAGADGRGRRLILEEPGYSLWGPSWSPDGSQIAFTRSITAFMWPGSPRSELYIANADGTNMRQLTNNGRNNYLPAWSPDGSQIAFISVLGGGWDTHEIYVIRLDTGEEKRLTENDAQEYGVSWSPDGTKLAFGTKREGEMRIYTMNPDGSEQQSIAKPAAGYSPAWSPDGSQIVFTMELDDHSDIMIMNADGTNKRLLAGGPGWDYLPVWSPDGSQIAFTSTRDGAAAIYVAAADGSSIEKLSGRGLTADVVSWSPDGRYVVFNGAP